MPTDLLPIVESTILDAETISRRTAQIHADVMSRSKYIHAPNFTKIHPDDMAILFAEYDGRFFGGQIKATLGMTPLHFRPKWVLHINGDDQQLLDSGAPSVPILRKLTT